MKRIIFIFPVLLTAIQGFAQFKANMEMSMDGNKLHYLVYSGEDRYRYEFSQGSQDIVLIINTQAGKSFMLIPAQKIFMPMDQGNMMQQGNDPVKNYDRLRKSCTEKVAGKETIEGYECEKRELYKNDQKIMTVWYSPVLNFPLKLTDHNKGLRMALTNIQKWKPDPSMFIVPENYHSIMQ